MKADATTMKLTATPWPESLRNAMPTATVVIHTISPVGESEVGRRHPRASSQPAAVPVRNGHAVSINPETVMPSAWLRRPTAQKARTHTTSAITASEVRLEVIVQQSNS